MKGIRMKTFVLVAALSVASFGAANAATFTGTFTGKIDLTSLGGSSETAYSIEYNFASDDAGTDIGIFNPGRDIFRYSGISGSATIGVDTFNFSNASITIENDNGLPFDSYLFKTGVGTTTGTLLGQPLDTLDFQLFDLTATALSNTSLITSDLNPFAFSNVQTFVELAGDGDGIADAYTFTPISSGSEFSLTFSKEPMAAIPLPAGLPLMLSGLLGMGILARRKKIA